MQDEENECEVGICMRGNCSCLPREIQGSVDGASSELSGSN